MIFIGSDHAGYFLKSLLIKPSMVDIGCFSEDSVDYSDIAHLMMQKVLETPCALGILICGTGIGMSIAANRFQGIRAALCTSAFETTMARAHNNANIMCMGSRVIGLGQAQSCLEAFFSTPFEGGRHERRIEKIKGGL
jgi:ribose 5-phosphate isomerase B